MQLVYKFDINHSDRLCAICRVTNNLYNQALYIVRNELKDNDRWLFYPDLGRIMKNVTNLEGTVNYRLVKSHVAQQTLRLLDLAGLRGISLETVSEDINSEYMDDIVYMYSKLSFTEAIYVISIISPVDCSDFSTVVNHMIFSIFAFSKHLGIDLLWHIEQKMRYNELRPMFHGKKY